MTDPLETDPRVQTIHETLVWTHDPNTRVTSDETMTAMEARLGSSGFMRINRSVILNLSRIKELQPLAAGEYVVILKTGVRLNMTCSLRELQTRMGHA